MQNNLALLQLQIALNSQDPKEFIQWNAFCDTALQEAAKILAATQLLWKKSSEVSLLSDGSVLAFDLTGLRDVNQIQDLTQRSIAQRKIKGLIKRLQIALQNQQTGESPIHLISKYSQDISIILEGVEGIISQEEIASLKEQLQNKKVIFHSEIQLNQGQIFQWLGRPASLQIRTDQAGRWIENLNPTPGVALIELMSETLEIQMDSVSTIYQMLKTIKILESNA